MPKMSGAELGFVIGLVSGTLTLLDTIAKVINATRDESPPKTIHNVAQKVFLMQETLRAVESRMAAGFSDDERHIVLKPAIQNCQAKLHNLQRILSRSAPQPCASPVRRLVGMLHTYGQARRVKSLAQSVLEDVQLIAQRQAALGGVTEKQIGEVVAAALIASSSSTSPRETGANNNATISHYGRGSQNVCHGPMHQIVALGLGDVHIAGTQIFRF